MTEPTAAQEVLVKLDKESAGGLRGKLLNEANTRAKLHALAVVQGLMPMFIGFITQNSH